MTPTECPVCGGPAWCWADNSDGITVNFACDNAECAAGNGPWDTPRPDTLVDAGHVGACWLSALFGECPAGGDHVWAEQEAYDGTVGVACDNCHASPPPVDPDDFPGL